MKKKTVWSRATNVFSFKIPCQLIDTIDYIIAKTGRYSSRSDFVREAIRRLIAEELKLLQPTMPKHHSSMAVMQIKVIDIQKDIQEEDKDIDV